MGEMEKTSSQLTDALKATNVSLEKQLRNSEDGCSKLRAEACTLKEAALAKARRFEATSKVSQWRVTWYCTVCVGC